MKNEIIERKDGRNLEKELDVNERITAQLEAHVKVLEGKIIELEQSNIFLTNMLQKLATQLEQHLGGKEDGTITKDG